MRDIPKPRSYTDTVTSSEGFEEGCGHVLRFDDAGKLIVCEKCGGVAKVIARRPPDSPTSLLAILCAMTASAITCWVLLEIYWCLINF